MKWIFTKRFSKRQIAWSALIVFLLMQVFRIDKSNPVSVSESDFITITQPDSEIANILKSSCYDCHSHKTKYPWYTDIAPFSWWIKGHIKEGRKHLNFSLWGEYNEKKQNHKLEECAEMVGQKSMPLMSYWIAHSEAKLSPDQRQNLVDWFSSL